ncbi:MAG: nucleotidyltransferase domain-containing protein [Candidatus Methanomethylicia archaeon]
MKPIHDLYDILKDLPKMFSDVGRVKSIIVFGSAARPRDFTPKVSDVDVLIVTDDEPSIGYCELNIRDYRVSLVFMDIDRLKRLFEIGDPLSFMLKYSVIIIDDGTYQSIMKSPLKITEHTKHILRRSIFVALSLAVEKYFHEEYIRSISHLYHSIRHLVRYTACLNGKPEKFPITDDEIYEASGESIREIFKTLRDARRRNAYEREVYSLIDETIRTVSNELNLNSIFLRDLKGMIKGVVEEVEISEVNDEIKFKLMIIEDDNLKMLEINGRNIREIRNVDIELMG